MGISVGWDNPQKTIIRVTFEEEWTWDDFAAIDKVAAGMVDTISHKVCYIADVRKTSTVPPGLQLTVVRNVLEFRHPNSDMLVIVGLTKVMRMLLNTVLQALGPISTRMKIVDTIDEAYTTVNYRLLEIERSQF